MAQESACNAGIAGGSGSILSLEKSSGGGYGNPLQYSCLETPMGRRAWWATVRRVIKSGAQLKDACKDLSIAQGTLLNTL